MIKKLLAVALFVALFGVMACDRFVRQDTKKPHSPDSAEITSAQPPQTFAAELDKMKEDIANLNAILMERETELVKLQASLASKDASVINMTAELAYYKKNIKIVAIVLAVSLILNLLLVWLLLKNYKKLPRLALPAAEDKKDKSADSPKSAPVPPKDATNADARATTVQKTSDVPKQETSQPAKVKVAKPAEKPIANSAGTIVPEKPRRGRKPKNPENK